MADHATNAGSGAGVLSAGHRLGRYEVLAKLAAGGMAVVYVARAHGVGGFERLVALKILHANLAYEEEFIKMFLDEARLAARIRHPNVVPTIDISDALQTGFYLVMDYIEGDHLGALLSGAHRAGQRLPVGVVLRVMIDALGGLAAAHALKDESGNSLNLVHRDVSPHNIMVGIDGVARLTDFGVAKAEDRLTHTRDGQVKGKLAYMAPEQASSGRSDARSDLFSVGIILWECLAGRRLFRGESTAATLNKLLHEEIAPLCSVDPELAPLDPVLARALARDPNERFSSAGELSDALEEVARQVGGLSSSRAVSQAVEEFAAVKLARERKSVEEAKGALARRVEGEESASDAEGADALSEPSQLSFSNTSVSFSKLSGVYSSGTAANVSLVGPPAPPPALGQFDPESLPEAHDARRPTGSPMLRVVLIVALLVGAVLLWAQAPPAEAPAAVFDPPAPAASEPPATAVDEPPATAVDEPPAAAQATEEPPGEVISAPTLQPPTPPDRLAKPAADRPPAAAAPPPRRGASAPARTGTRRSRRRPDLIDNPYRR